MIYNSQSTSMKRNFAQSYRQAAAYCPTCRRAFTPRILMDGSYSRTCGAPACVSANAARNFSHPSAPRPATGY